MKIFAIRINNTEDKGIIDISKNPPELYCLCSEEVSEEILGKDKEIQSLTERLQKAEEKLKQYNQNEV